MTYISPAIRGKIYIAEPSRKGSRRLLWSVMSETHSADMRTESNKVPLVLRRQAYRRFASAEKFITEHGRPTTKMNRMEP